MPMPTGALPTYGVCADVPLKDPTDDTLDRWPFAQGVARAILSTPLDEGFVIGIHGPWGDGKSTVLNFVARVLHVEKIPVVRYNPWRFTDEDRMTAAFFEDLSTSAGSRRSRIRRLLSEYGMIVADCAEVASDRAGKGVRTAAKLSEKSLEVRHDELVELMRTKRERRAVLIDDVDRLDKHELFALFRMIKACADLPGVVYVLAFDDGVVADALQERYGSRDPLAGRKFLEKIVQMPLSLPPAAPVAIEHQVRRGLDDIESELALVLDGSDRSRFDAAFELGMRPAIHTPRQVKQYINAARFALSALAREANPVDVMLVEGLRCLFPRAHAVVRRHADLFMGGSTREQGVIDAGKLGGKIWGGQFERMPIRERLAAQHLLQTLFPRLALGTIRHGFSPLDVAFWESQRRVCAPSYCARYFTYAVPSTDLSDLTADDIVEDAKRSQSPTLVSKVAAALEPVRMRATVRRLQSRAASLSEGPAERLADAIAAFSNRFEEPFSLEQEGPGREVAKLVTRIAAGVADPDRRTSLHQRMIATTPSVWFAGLLWKQIECELRDGGGKADKASGVSTVLDKALTDRIVVASTDGLVFLSLARRWPFELLRIWARLGGSRQINEMLTSGMSSDRAIATNLLKSLTQPVSASGQHVPEPMDLTSEHLSILATMINLPAMIDTIRRNWMRGLAQDPEAIHALPIEERLLSQLLFVFAREGHPVLPPATTTG